MMTCSMDLERFEAEVDSALRDLAEDLHRAGVRAAEDGVALAKASHPYQDHTPTDGLTDSARAEEDTVTGGGIMIWPAEYASFVDKGTSRARPYPFTPKAEKLAAVMLNAGANEALLKFQRALER